MECLRIIRRGSVTAAGRCIRRSMDDATDWHQVCSVLIYCADVRLRSLIGHRVCGIDFFKYLSEYYVCRQMRCRFLAFGLPMP